MPGAEASASFRGVRWRAAFSPATESPGPGRDRSAPRPTTTPTSLYYRDSDFTVVDRVTEIAGKRGVSNAQVALAWMLSKPEITAPIVGASKPHHLDDALAALELHLDAEEIKALEEPYEPHPILGHN